MLNTSFSAAELEAVLEREQPRVLVHDEEFADVVTEAGPGGCARIVAAPDGAGSGFATLRGVARGRPRRSTLPPRRAGW